MDPHIKCQVVCVLLSAAPHIYGRAELSAGGRGGGAAGLKLQLCPDPRHPPALTSHDTLHLSPAPGFLFHKLKLKGYS